MSGAAILRKMPLPVQSSHCVDRSWPEWSTTLCSCPQVVELGDFSLFCHAPDEAAFIYDEIFRQHVYVQHGIHLSGEATVVDVGANIGLFSIFCCTAVAGAQCKVWAVEPLPPNLDSLQANIVCHQLEHQASCHPLKGLCLELLPYIALGCKPDCTWLTAHILSGCCVLRRSPCFRWLLADKQAASSSLLSTLPCQATPQLIHWRSGSCRLTAWKHPVSCLLSYLTVKWRR